MFKVKVENRKQLEIVIASKNVSEIILSRDSFAEKDLPKLVNQIKESGKLAWILMERISRYEENMKFGIKPNLKVEPHDSTDLRLSTDKIFEIKNLDGIIIQNLDSFAYMLRKINKVANEKLKVELNYTMNCYNNMTKNVFENMYNIKRKNAKTVPLLFTAPVELNIYELSVVGYDTMILYSYIDTMVSANCLKKNLNLGTGYIIGKKGTLFKNVKNQDNTTKNSICKNRFNFNKVEDFSSYIIDRKGKKLHYKTYCKYCYNKIFNTEPLYLLDKIDELGSALINFNKSVDKKYIEKDNSDLTSGINSKSSFRIDFSFENEKEVNNILNGICPDSFTRGHIKNSIK